MPVRDHTFAQPFVRVTQSLQKASAEHTTASVRCHLKLAVGEEEELLVCATAVTDRMPIKRCREAVE